MRKLIWIALALGAVELIKREAAKRGLTSSAFLSNLATNAVGNGTGEKTPPSP